MLSILHPFAKLKLPHQGHRRRVWARVGLVPRSRRGCPDIPSHKETQSPFLCHCVSLESGQGPQRVSYQFGLA